LKDGVVHLAAGQRRRLIQVAVRVDTHQRSAEIDFTGDVGAADQQLQRADGGLHGGRAVCKLHTLVDDDIRSTPDALPLKVIIPAVSMLNPLGPAGVGGGNETSSCITNALYGAGVMAVSQQRRTTHPWQMTNQ
jgi:5-oxoprolinase (ATP-hydrolysing)